MAETLTGRIRAKYEVLQGDKRIAALARLRIGSDPVHAPVLTALRMLARRVQSLTEEHAVLTAELDDLVTRLNPGDGRPNGQDGRTAHHRQAQVIAVEDDGASTASAMTCTHSLTSTAR
ncbi:hypothetical protein [Streptomyces kaempferi]|uniref:Transposase n=1 Tax=Streptomyces kaempferi TaxID=333725 RepID=A0ABW3XUZ9_9ACTN